MTLLHTPTRLTAQEAQLIAEEFIQQHIGDQVLAGEPWPVLTQNLRNNSTNLLNNIGRH